MHWINVNQSKYGYISISRLAIATITTNHAQTMHTNTAKQDLQDLLSNHSNAILVYGVKQEESEIK